MPMAMPNSPLVSEIDAAEPAFCGGAAPIMRFIVTAIGSEMPNAARTNPATRSGSPLTGSTRVCRPTPRPAMASPSAIT